MKVFTKEELKKYDGSNGIAYIAFIGSSGTIAGMTQWQGSSLRLGEALLQGRKKRHVSSDTEIPHNYTGDNSAELD